MCKDRKQKVFKIFLGVAERLRIILIFDQEILENETKKCSLSAAAFRETVNVL